MIVKFILSPLTILMLCLAGTSAKAADLSITAFFGAFQGSGVAENADSLYFGTTARDLDIVIGADNTGGAFFVRWTTLTIPTPAVKLKISYLTIPISLVCFAALDPVTC